MPAHSRRSNTGRLVSLTKALAQAARDTGARSLRITEGELSIAVEMSPPEVPHTEQKERAALTYDEILMAHSEGIRRVARRPGGAS